MVTRQVNFPASNLGEVAVEYTQQSSPSQTFTPSTSTPPQSNVSESKPTHIRPSSPDPIGIPGKYIETPRLEKQSPPLTPLNSSTSFNNTNAPKKPNENFILLGAPPIPSINLQNDKSSGNSNSKEDLPRRSNRERKPANPGENMVPNTQRYQAYAVRVEPNTYHQAMKSNDHELWRAVEEEMSALNKNHTWDAVTRPKDKNIVGSKWVFKIKHKADGSVDRYKARLVAKGFSQQPGTDYDETYAPVARYDSLRLLLALAAHNGWTQGNP